MKINFCKNIFKYFLLFILVSYSLMLVYRDFVIPYRFHLNSGLLPGDSEYYSAIALIKSKEIQINGWKKFEIFPSGHGPAGIASLIFVFSENAKLYILLNAVMLSASTILLILMLKEWHPDSISFLSSFPLILSPYMMLWFSQINKENYVILGTNLLVYGIIRWVKNFSKDEYKYIFLSFLLMIAGVFIIWIGRSYLNKILLPLVSVLLLLPFVFNYKKLQSVMITKLKLFCYCLLVFCMYIFSSGGSASNSIEKYLQEDSTSKKILINPIDINNNTAIPLEFNCQNRVDNWKEVIFLNNYLNTTLKSIARQRCLTFSLIETHSFDEATQYSIVDKDILPASSLEMIFYLPKSFFNGFFLPTPESIFWAFDLNKVSFFYLIVPIEMCLIYIGFVFFALWIVKNKVWMILLPVVICVWVVIFYGISTPYVGALYRYRYPEMSILFSFSIATFLQFTKHRFFIEK